MSYLLFLQSNDDVASAILFQTSFLNGFGALFQNLDGFDLAGRNLVEFLFAQLLLSALEHIVCLIYHILLFFIRNHQHMALIAQSGGKNIGFATILQLQTLAQFCHGKWEVAGGDVRLGDS